MGIVLVAALGAIYVPPESTSFLSLSLSCDDPLPSI